MKRLLPYLISEMLLTLVSAAYRANFQGFPHSMGLAAFSHVMGNWWENTCTSHVTNGKSIHTMGKVWVPISPRFSTFYGFCRILPGTNFLDFPHSMALAVFSYVVGNGWENTCISYAMKCITGWECNGKKTPILWKNYGNLFPRPFPFDGFCWLF